MRWLLVALVLLFSPIASAQPGKPKACLLPGCADGVTVPGLSGTMGNEDTLKYLQELPSFQALPDLATTYYSADNNPGCDPVLTGPNAGTCLPAGNDTTGNGSAELPFLTMTKCLEMSAFGYHHCVFDSADAWDTTSDETGSNNYTLAATAVCADTDDACVVWGSSDRTGGDPATFDCLGMFGANTLGANALFTDARAASAGYWAFENLRLTNCPNELTASGDIFRTDTPSDMVLLNIQVPSLQGDNNEFFTSHNTGADMSEVVMINPYCHIPDWANTSSGGTADASLCLWSLSESVGYIVIGGEFSSSDDFTSGDEVLIRADNTTSNDKTYLSIIGSTIRNLDASSSGQSKHALGLYMNSSGQVINAGILMTAIQGYRDAASAESSIDTAINSSVTLADLDVYLYKVSIGGAARYQIRYQDSSINNSTADFTGACLAMESATTRSLMEFAATGGADCSQVSVNIDQVVLDETNTPFPYLVEGLTASTSQGASGFEDDSNTAGCRNAPWTFNGTNDTTPFGTTTQTPYCRDSSCYAGCTVDGLWTFPNNGKIPAFVTGQRINGFSFTATTNIGR